MAIITKTPGVYIEEIPRLGSSIAGVPTAVAGFTGYTQTAIIDGEQWDYNDGPAPPVRITSLLEFQEIFGGPNPETFDVKLTGTVATPTTIAVSTPGGLSNYILFYQVRMFYANGGGTCWIVSVGDYTNNVIDKDELLGGIELFEQIDEVTLLSTPEAIFLESTPVKKRKEVYEKMAKQCAKLQDRFTIIDTEHISGNTIFEDATDFRDNDIGPDNLKYVSTYYPALNTSLEYAYNEADVTIDDTRTQGAAPNNYEYDSPFNKLPFILNGTNAYKDFTVSGTGPFVTTGNDDFKIQIDLTTFVTMKPESPPNPNNPDEYDPGSTTRLFSTNALITAINAHPVLSQFVVASLFDDSPIVLRITARAIGGIGKTYTVTTVGTTFGTAGTYNLENGVGADKDLYNRIKAEIAKYTLTLYPSASIAGVYARVDETRGVWKAPANVGLSLSNEPSVIIDAQNQENLNVDSVSGKSINAIRQFAGRGTLVWGARTLAGNDNEWRYINVRRLFIFVEESCKKATEFVVFESNTAVTWNRVKNMIEAFLTDLWRDGALAGATTKDAFFVQVGLGQTMTPNDILNGKMIVRIGMAAARPAEFIILQFEHKLQES